MHNTPPAIVATTTLTLFADGTADVTVTSYYPQQQRAASTVSIPARSLADAQLVTITRAARIVDDARRAWRAVADKLNLARHDR